MQLKVELDSIQGDVVVGWINAGTSRGGVDDYFLSGRVIIQILLSFNLSIRKHVQMKKIRLDNLLKKSLFRHFDN